ncbi:MAG: ATP-dependent DNA helicase RecG [Deltaproteobacteria bacterium]|nr:ATP-dependent DNA helicase RecG [Deltaproteobacteria bacterium]
MQENTSKCDAESRLSGIIESILKPLKFASKDNFHHLNSVKSIEPLVLKLCGDALTLGLSADRETALKELKASFTGFDALTPEEKRERVGKGISLSIAILRPHAGRPYTMTAGVVRDKLNTLKTPLGFVKGIGPKLSERLVKKGLATVEDILYFLPLRYEDRSRIKKIKELTPGANEVTTGEVLASGETRYGRRRVFEVAVGDGASILKLKWFNFKSVYMKSRFKNGQKLIIFGQVALFGNQKEMIHPDTEAFDEEEANGPGNFKGVVPVYSQIENFHQKTVRKLVRNIVDQYSEYAVGGVPVEIIERAGLLDLPSAFRILHMAGGGSLNETALAKKTLAFDELFLLELGLALKRNQARKEGGISFKCQGELETKLKGLLPFKLTDAQERVLNEIKKDMESPYPMNRLIQGDVGSGKTIVSLISALNAVEAGYQAAIMAPTEILSEQHYLTTHRYADRLGIKTVLLLGGMTKAEKKEALLRIKEGGADLVIGTHALIQKDVEFHKLGLAVIDEQHRFGVVQRAALKKKGFRSEDGVSPDILIMTATPIPRTLSMTVFGDLDVSTIDELPPGRHPVLTRVIKEKDRQGAYARIRQELTQGSQCYVVYPLVEESEELSLKDATNMQAHLQRDIFPEFKSGLLHGRMKAEDKEAVMSNFKARKLDILVSTTVIEVGVDVPNATVMLIEHAERFGLAQLHQLRGRVGRGEKKSICLLLASWTQSEDTFKRLRIMEETMDGFRIAEEDLNIRGPGDFIGTRQAGMPDFRTSEALSDLNLLKKAREEAFRFFDKDQALANGEAACVREVLKARWQNRLELAEIG